MMEQITVEHGESGSAPARSHLTGKVNVSVPERWASVIGGGVLAVYGLTRKDKLGPALAALGVATAWRGATGHCNVYQAIGANTAEMDHSDAASVKHGEGIRVEKTMTINKPADVLYRYWRNFENLPRFMNHLESVQMLSAARSHWVVKGPAGTSVEWDAMVINEEPGTLIAWQSVDDADVNNAGSVRFMPAPGDKGTEVRVNLEYAPPAGKLGAMVAKMFGEEPQQQIQDDLRRFKQMMEAGEIATTDGQATNGSAPR